MPGISCVQIDSAGGQIKGPGSPILTINGAPVSLVGDAVEPHGNGPHAAPVMVEGSGILTVMGIPVVLAGKKASCDHAATGSAKHTCFA